MSLVRSEQIESLICDFSNTNSWKAGRECTAGLYDAGVVQPHAAAGAAIAGGVAGTTAGDGFSGCTPRQEGGSTRSIERFICIVGPKRYVVFG